MNLPIRVFEIMADIAEENNGKSVKWARASGVGPPEFESSTLTKTFRC